MTAAGLFYPVLVLFFLQRMVRSFPLTFLISSAISEALWSALAIALTATTDLRTDEATLRGMSPKGSCSSMCRVTHDRKAGSSAYCGFITCKGQINAR